MVITIISIIIMCDHNVLLRPGNRIPLPPMRTSRNRRMLRSPVDELLALVRLGVEVPASRTVRTQSEV